MTLARVPSMRWEIVKKAAFGGGSIEMIAWRTSGGHLAFAGITITPYFSGGNPSFPVMIFGGGPGCFPGSKRVFRRLSSLDGDIAWRLSPSFIREYSNEEELEEELVKYEKA